MSRLRLPVEEYTTPNPVTASEELDLQQLQSIMKENGIRHLPIVRGSQVVGIVSERDLKVADGLTSNQKIMVRAADIMIKDPITVGSNDSLEDVAFLMSKNKIGSVIVNDEKDEFLGIFTLTDALNALIEITRDEIELKSM